MTVSLNRQKSINKKTGEDVDDKDTNLNARLNDVETMKNEIIKLSSLRDMAKVKVAECEGEKKDLEEKKELIASKTDHTRDVLVRGIQREIDVQNRIKASLRTELNIVSKKYSSADHVVAALEDILHMNNNTIKNLSFEKCSLEQSISTTQAKIDAMNEEKNK
jgi:chromosome segregation ATPase